MANIFLDANDSFTQSSTNTNDSIFGRSGGSETVILQGNPTGTTLDGNLEVVQVATTAANTTLQVNATTGRLELASGGTVFASFSGGINAPTLSLQFTDGNVLLSQTGANAFTIATPGSTTGNVTINPTTSQTGSAVTLGADKSTAGGETTTPPVGGQAFTLAESANTVAEGGSITYTVTSSGVVSADTTLTVAVTGNDLGGAAAAAASTDFALSATSVTFAAGSAAGSTQTFTVTANTDSIEEGLEGIKVSLLDGSFATVASETSAITNVAAADLSQTFTLTNSANQTTGGADNLTGTAANDTFLAVANASLDNGDVVDGAGGTDTLTARYSLSDNKTVNAAVSNVEIVNIDLDDGKTATAETLSFSVGSFTGLTNVNIQDAASTNAAEDTVNITNIAAGVELGLTRGDANYIADFDFADVTGGADKVTLNLNVAKADNVIIAGVEEITVDAESGSSTLDELNIAQATKMTLTGSGNLTVTDLDPGTNTVLKTIDASAATGNISLTGFIAGDISVTGGTGNDTFDVSTGDLAATDTVVGGDGTDRIINDASMTTTLTNVSGIEELEAQVDADGTGDVEISGAAVSGINTFIVDANDTDLTNGDAHLVTVSNMASGNTLIIDDASSDTAAADGTDVTATFATDAADDVLNVQLSGIGATGADSTTGLSVLTADQADTLNIASNANTSGTVQINGVEAISAQAAKSMVITGSAELNVAALTNTTALTSIDASAATGKVTLTGIDASKLTFTAGSADTTITLAGLNNEDKLTGGAGTKDKVTATAVNGLTATTGKLAITNFEIVELAATGANTIDASSLSGVNTLTFTGATPGTQTVANLAAGLAIGVGSSAAEFDGGSTIDAALADATGTADSLTFNVDATSAAANAAIKTANIETLNFLFKDGTTNNSTLGMANAAAASIVATGGATGQDLAFNTLNKATTSFDASAVTGDVTVSLANSTAATTISVGKAESATTSITGSAQKDTITVGETADAVTVNGGAEVDTLNMSVKNDFIDTSNISNVENINLTVKSGEDVTITNAGGLNNAATDNIVILGGNTLSTFTTGTLTANTIQTVNASAFGGNVVAVFDDDVLGTATTVTGGSLATDSVTATYDTAGTYVIKTTAVETVDLQADKDGTSGETYTFNMLNATGITTLALRAGAAVSDDTTVNVTSLVAGAKVALGSAAGQFFGSSTAAITLASNSGTADALTLRLVDTDGNTDTATVTAAGVETLNVEVANSAEVHTVNLSGVDATAGSKQTINVTGGQAGAAVTIANVDTTTNVIDASGFLGNLILSDRASTATTITGGIGNDQIRMENATDVLNGGSGTDTLTIAQNAVLGGIEVDLSATGDQVTTYNGSANAAVQSGFENVDVSGYTGSFGAQVTAAAGGSTIRGTTNNDVVNMGAGADTLQVGTTTTQNGIDIVNTFTGGTDFIDIVFGDGGLANNAALRGDGTDAQVGNVSGGAVALDAALGFLINNGANAGDLEVGTQVTALAQSNANITANDAFYYLTDNGTDSALFLFRDVDGGGDVDAGEVTKLVTLVGLADASTVTAAQLSDFVAA